MRNRTFPKENQKKMNEIIRELKSVVKQKDKEIQFLRDELENVVKPQRDRKTHVDKKEVTVDEWRKDFIRRFKRDVLGEKS